MAVRTTVDIPELLHDRLRQRAEQSGTSMRALILKALDQTYGDQKKGKYVTGPMITGKGKRGPKYPVDENPHELIFS